MPRNSRDLIFLSYSRKDEEIYSEVEQKLMDRDLGKHLWDDTEIRLSEQWDERIREAMDRTAVAVLLLSDHYFGRSLEGDEYGSVALISDRQDEATCGRN